MAPATVKQWIRCQPRELICCGGVGRCPWARGGWHRRKMRPAPHSRRFVHRNAMSLLPFGSTHRRGQCILMRMFTRRFELYSRTHRSRARRERSFSRCPCRRPIHRHRRRHHHHRYRHYHRILNHRSQSRRPHLQRRRPVLSVHRRSIKRFRQHHRHHRHQCRRCSSSSSGSARVVRDHA